MWDILGIPATDDQKIIRKAYAAKLRAVGNSGDRTAFQQLRNAYERALASAERKGAARDGRQTTPSSRQEVEKVDVSRPIAPTKVFPSPTALPQPTPDAHAPLLRPERNSDQGIETVESLNPAREENSLLSQIQASLERRDIESALALYDRGLAHGTLPIGTHEAVLDHIMAACVSDLSLDPATFIGLVRRIGWEDAQVGQSISRVRSAATSRLDAEKWLKRLRVVAEWNSHDASFWRDVSHVTHWSSSTYKRYEHQNARLLLVDRPQLPRILQRSVANLNTEVAQFYHHKRWLGGRITDRCVDRAERMLAFDKRWGKLIRRFGLPLLIWIPLGIPDIVRGQGAIFEGPLFVLLAAVMLRGAVRSAKASTTRLKKLAKTYLSSSRR